MARPHKQGLEYFNLDVDFFEDDKIAFISASYGLKGDAIAVRLLCKIYKNGYFINFDQDVALLFSRSVGDINSVGLVKEVVSELLKRGFFDKAVFERFGILTSKAIQKRYAKVCTDAKRKDWVIDDNYDLISKKTPLTPSLTILPPVLSTQIERDIERDSKINTGGETPLVVRYSDIEKNKVSIYEFIKYHKPKEIDPYFDFWNLFAKEKGFPSLQTLNDSRKKKFKTRIGESAFDFGKILYKAANSDFIKASGFFTFDWIIENQVNYVKVIEGNYDNKDPVDKQQVTIKPINGNPPITNTPTLN